MLSIIIGVCVCVGVRARECMFQSACTAAEWLVTIQRRSATWQGRAVEGGKRGRRGRDEGRRWRRRQRWKGGREGRGGEGRRGDVPPLSLFLSLLRRRLPLPFIHSLAPLVFLSAVCHTVLLSRLTHLPLCPAIYHPPPTLQSPRTHPPPSAPLPSCSSRLLLFLPLHLSLPAVSITRRSFSPRHAIRLPLSDARRGVR